MSDYALTPVDHDPFAAAPVADAGVRLTPVDHDPFASQPSAATSPEPTLLQKLDTGARAINMGIPFTDRLTAGVETLPLIGNGKSYDENLADERATRARFQQEYPWKALTGETIGGLLTTLAMPGGVAAEAGLVPALGIGARTGAAYGAAQGLSDQPDLSNVGADIGGTLRGAAEGGALGSVFSGLGYGAGRTGSAIVDRLSPSVKPIEDNWSATKSLMNAYRNDQSTGASPDLGPNGMLLDSGPSMLQLAKDTSATPQGTPIRTAVADRANSVDRNISQALPGIIGPDQSALAAATSLKADRSAAGKALQPIFANAPQVDTSPVLAQLSALMNKLPNGSPELNALRKVQDYLAPTVDIGGGLTMRMQVSDAETLDSAKRAIDGLINFGDPTIGVAPGVLASKAGALKMIAGGINQSLRDQVPGYGDTMDSLSSLARQVEGIQYGRDLLNTGKTAIHPSDAAGKIGGMTPEELDAARTGVNSEIYRRAGTSANGTALDALNAILPSAEQTGDRWNAEKLGQVFAPEKVDALTTLQNQGNRFRSVNDAIKAPRQPSESEVNLPGMVTDIHDVLTPPFGWARIAARKGSDAMDWLTNASPKRNDALARVLTAQGDAKDSIAATLGDLLARRAAAQNAGMTLAPIFAGAGLGAVDR